MSRIIQPRLSRIPRYIMGNGLLSVGGGVAPFSPSDIANLVLWLDAATITSITKDGSNKVSQWNDLSTSANHATQSTSANQPTYNATGFNVSYPSITQTGSPQCMNLTTPIALAGKTVFWVGHISSITVGGDGSGWWGDSTNVLAIQYNQGGGAMELLGGAGANTEFADPPNTTAVRVRCVRFTNGDWKYFKNGVAQGFLFGTNGTKTATGSMAKIGGWGGNAIYFLTGGNSSFIIYNASLSDANIVLVTDYLKTRYGVA